MFGDRVSVFSGISLTAISNKMAGDSSGEVKQVLLATEAELYIEELKTYPLKETGSPKYVSVAL